MVTFFAVGEKNNKKPVHNLVVKKINGHEYYRLASLSDSEKRLDDTKIIEAIKFNSLPEIKKHFYEKHAIIKIPGQPDLLLESIHRYDSKIKCFISNYNAQKIKCDQEVAVMLLTSKIKIFF